MTKAKSVMPATASNLNPADQQLFGDSGGSGDKQIVSKDDDDEGEWTFEPVGQLSGEQEADLAAFLGRL